MRLSINDSQILWPGKLERKPEGIIIPTHLKVLTIEEKPFIYKRRLEVDEPECDPKEEVPCPFFNATDGTGEWAIALALIRFDIARTSVSGRDIWWIKII